MDSRWKIGVYLFFLLLFIGFCIIVIIAVDNKASEGINWQGRYEIEDRIDSIIAERTLIVNRMWWIAGALLAEQDVEVRNKLHREADSLNIVFDSTTVAIEGTMR